MLAVLSKEYGSISLWLGEYDNGWKDWEHKENIEDANYKVLYFCYPDPIPKAYENLMERL